MRKHACSCSLYCSFHLLFIEVVCIRYVYALLTLRFTHYYVCLKDADLNVLARDVLFGINGRDAIFENPRKIS